MEEKERCARWISTQLLIKKAHPQQGEAGGQEEEAHLSQRKFPYVAEIGSYVFSTVSVRKSILSMMHGCISAHRELHTQVQHTALPNLICWVRITEYDLQSSQWAPT